MTHYWWMHWFWITWALNFLLIQVTVTTIHSNKNGLLFSNISNETNRLAKAIGVPKFVPPTNKTSTNVSDVKISRPSHKKPDFFFINKTVKVNSSKGCNETHNMTVINQSNLTDNSVNMTDNQMLINTTLNAINHTENLTYLEDINYNQSLIQNPITSDIEKASLESDLSGNLSAAGITGITLGCVVIVGVICGVSYFLYRNRSFNRPQVLNDRCSNPDSSGYIDDASVRDNSEEMYSLDNDSFLNSLEAMTIQNYWTDTVKHTKL